ncbi:hypothetical protein B0H12DRAFT_1074297 [Mycena haematopus]|nr:hypothetical protein B0H12DRAFT_1074297 [Mycena haematopus]
MPVQPNIFSLLLPAWQVLPLIALDLRLNRAQSGYSYTGGPSRCSAYWQEFTKCYTNATFPKQCGAERDDYLECVHRTKEKARNATIQAEFERQQARSLQDHKHPSMRRRMAFRLV